MLQLGTNFTNVTNFEHYCAQRGIWAKGNPIYQADIFAINHGNNVPLLLLCLAHSLLDIKMEKKI